MQLDQAILEWEVLWKGFFPLGSIFQQSDLNPRWLGAKRECYRCAMPSTQFQQTWKAQKGTIFITALKSHILANVPHKTSHILQKDLQVLFNLKILLLNNRTIISGTHSSRAILTCLKVQNAICQSRTDIVDFCDIAKHGIVKYYVIRLSLQTHWSAQCY